MTKRWWRAALALTALIGAGCGSDDGSEEAAATSRGDFPVTVTGGNGQVTVDERPERIVVLSASLTESVFAVGAGEQVIAVDSDSDHPDDAPVSGLSAFRPNVEAIAKYEPDLVLLSRSADDIAATLESVGIPALVLPSASDLNDVYEQIETVGAVTGHRAEAAELSESMRAEIDEQLARLDADAASGTYFYELSAAYHSLTSETFVGSILREMGLTNIADPVDPAAGPYPQLSAEVVIDADPDRIFVAHTDGTMPTVEMIAARPGWDSMTAVQSRAITIVDADVASRWGPRVVDLVTVLVDAVIEE